MKDLMKELKEKVTFNSIKNRIDTQKDVISHREFMIETQDAPLKDFPYVTKNRVSSVDEAENVITIVLNDERVTKFISKYDRIVIRLVPFIDTYDNMLYLEISFYPN